MTAVVKFIRKEMTAITAMLMLVLLVTTAVATVLPSNIFLFFVHMSIILLFFSIW